MKKNRRKKGEGSIYQRSDGRWVAAVTGHGGRTKRIYGTTAEKVTEALARARNQQLDGIPFTDERLTVGRWLDTWLKNVKPPHTAPKTWIAYEYFVRLHLAPRLSHIRLKELQPQHVHANSCLVPGKRIEPAYGEASPGCIARRAHQRRFGKAQRSRPS